MVHTSVKGCCTTQQSAAKKWNSPNCIKEFAMQPSEKAMHTTKHNLPLSSTK